MRALFGLLLLAVMGWILWRVLTQPRRIRDLQRREFELGLSKASDEELRRRIAECPYFDLAPGPGPSLRTTPQVQEFFRRLESEPPRTLLGQLNALMGSFLDAERSLGHTGRPMLVDYDGYLEALLRELGRRSPLHRVATGEDIVRH